MDAITAEFIRQVNDRDSEFAPDEWDDENKSLNRLYEGGKRVRFFDGSFAEKVETIGSYIADYDGDVADPTYGYTDGAHGEEFIVRWERVSDSEGFEYYFKIVGWNDSWDNGKPDAFALKDITRVEKVVPVKHEWKEVR